MACYANVIKGLKCQADQYIQIDDCNCNDCPYDLSDCGLKVPSNAIELLKEQSAQIERLKSYFRSDDMSDFEKVIKGLDYCKEYFDCCDQCPYWDGGLKCVPNLTKEALEVLKAQAARIKELEDDLREARGNKHVQ